MSRYTPVRQSSDSPWLQEVLNLIRASFAYMDGVIDPPSSVHRLDLLALREAARVGELWSLGWPPWAAVILTPKEDVLYLGKLAVASAHRRRGYAAQMVDLAKVRARAMGLAAVELESRVELVEVHAAFAAMGFVEVGRSAHDGFARPTSIMMRCWAS